MASHRTLAHGVLCDFLNWRIRRPPVGYISRMRRDNSLDGEPPDGFGVSPVGQKVLAAAVTATAYLILSVAALGRLPTAELVLVGMGAGLAIAALLGLRSVR